MTTAVFTINFVRDLFQVYDHNANFFSYFDTLRVAHDYLRSWKHFDKPYLVTLDVHPDPITTIQNDGDWALALLKYSEYGTEY